MLEPLHTLVVNASNSAVKQALRPSRSDIRLTIRESRSARHPFAHLYRVGHQPSQRQDAPVLPWRTAAELERQLHSLRLVSVYNKALAD